MKAREFVTIRGYATSVPAGLPVPWSFSVAVPGNPALGADDGIPVYETMLSELLDLGFTRDELLFNADQREIWVKGNPKVGILRHKKK